jgi:hypothetical protein
MIDQSHTHTPDLCSSSAERLDPPELHTTSDHSLSAGMQPGCTKDVMQARSFMFQVKKKLYLEVESKGLGF